MYQISNKLKDQSEIGEKIHSGQFMVSKYDEESDNEDTTNNKFNKKCYNFDSDSLKKTFQFVNKGQCDQRLNIDESLQTMFQYLSIAMSGKITNPKWNSFKGVKFQPKDKIRLNNIIWREYHMQFVKKLNPVVVQFASPLSETVQINGNVVLEGKYWKRRINIIVHQYKKWREFSKIRVTSEDPRETVLFDSILVQRNLYNKLYSTSPPPNLNDIFMDLDDLNLPINDITGVQHNSQIIQPQLNNLQPRMESSIDFLNDYFCAPHKTLKNQKLFSSETCLNVNPQEIDKLKRPYNQDHIPRYCDSIVGNPAARRPVDVSYQMTTAHVSNRKINIRPHYQQRQNSYQPDTSSNHSPDLGHCKTPNLLSILMQPLSSGSSLLQHQTSSGGNDRATGSNKQSLLITTSSFLKSTSRNEQINDSSMNVDKYEHSQNIDLNTYKMPHDLSYSEQVTVNPKYSKSIQNSAYNQSLRIKHSLNANNIVQEYLEELGSLLISTRDQNKISKAALLHKASENIKRLRIQKHKLQSEIVSLQSEIDSLQNRFSLFCSQLPATGVCLTSNRSSEGKRWFDDFVTQNSLTNWKFYVFSMMFESLFTGYNNAVNTVSIDSLAHNVAFWLEKECSLMKLRLIVINGMRTISRRTSIVHSPKLFEEEIKNLIGINSPSKTSVDFFKMASYQIVESHGPRHSDESKSVRYRCTPNSWPQIPNPNIGTYTSLERQDV